VRDARLFFQHGGTLQCVALRCTGMLEYIGIGLGATSFTELSLYLDGKMSSKSTSDALCTKYHYLVIVLWKRGMFVFWIRFQRANWQPIDSQKWRIRLPKFLSSKRQEKTQHRYQNMLYTGSKVSTNLPRILPTVIRWKSWLFWRKYRTGISTSWSVWGFCSRRIGYVTSGIPKNRSKVTETDVMCQALDKSLV
jgi:hypothetical protein